MSYEMVRASSLFETHRPSFISMYAESARESLRKSVTVPVFQPFFASFAFFRLSIAIVLQSSPACINCARPRLVWFFGKHVDDYDCIIDQPVYDLPAPVLMSCALDRPCFCKMKMTRPEQSEKTSYQRPTKQQRSGLIIGQNRV